MAKHLDDRPNVNPVCLINVDTEFGSEDEDPATSSSQIEKDNIDSASEKPDESEDDDFLTDTRHKGKKKRRIRESGEGVKMMLDCLKERWEEEKEAKKEEKNEEREAREEQKAAREEFMKQMRTSNQLQQKFVDVLNRIADKL